jgi:cobalt-zinc-cadmium efflux system outer membrane protein
VANAEVEVALRIPNPIVSYLGYARLSGTNQAINGSQHQIQVEQEIPLWGQRRARKVAADASVTLAEQNAGKLRNDVLAEARVTFVAVLVEQARHARLIEAHEHMTRLRTLIEGRVQTGLLGSFELQRSVLEEKRMRAAADRARVRVERLTGELAAFVDAPAWQPEAVGELVVPAAAAPATDTEHAPPELAAARAQEHAAQLNVALIDRERLPPLTVAAGGYFTTDGGSSSLLGGLSMPIPSFDTGRATQEKARRESYAASAARASVEAATAAQVRIADRERASLQTVYEALAQNTPEQLEALRTTAEQSYRVGTLGLDALLETLRAELEVKLETLDTLLELMVADVRLRALLGRVGEP